MVEFLKGALKVVKFFREAPGAEDNALERELAPLNPWQSVRVMSTQFLGAALSRLLNCVATGSPMGKTLLRLTWSWLQKAKA